MVDVFLDESGTHEGSLVTTMAGFVIAAEKLESLDLSWREELRRFKMQELHMKEFVPPHGKYSEWSNDRNGLFLSR